MLARRKAKPPEHPRVVGPLSQRARRATSPHNEGAHMTEISTPTLTASTSEIRAWAKENGHQVGDRGRIAKDVKDAFAAATGRLAE
nr:histone-like nucleoid-structuring protein Lsr2 [Actinoplanes ianthinogenes]